MCADKFEHKKSLGQHFLTSDVVPGWMCDAAEITEDDLVLEIGPGTGALTKVLLERGARVLALEADERAIDSLNTTFATKIAAERLTIEHYDVRALDFGTLEQLRNQPYKIVANIPYYLSGFLFRTCLEADPQPESLVFLVQKEVASRIARAEKESILSLSVKVYGEPSYIKTVTRGHFAPPPAVDSAIIAIYDISKARLTDVNPEHFFALVHLGMGAKRKQLLGNLAKIYDRNELVHIFSTLGIAETVRGEDLPLETWVKLAAKLPSTASPQITLE